MKFVRKIKPFYKDERGVMAHLLEKDTHITSALLITCKKGSIRANHYHKKDAHHCYMIKGSMEYTYQNLKSKRKNCIVVKEGEVVFTPPLMFHAMKFLEDSVFLALTTEPRDQKGYEHDTVRIKLI